MSKDQRWYLQESPDSEHYQEFKCISQHCRLQGCHQWFLHQYCTNRGEVVREFQLSGFSLPLTTYHPLLLYDASQQAVPMSARSSNAGRVQLMCGAVLEGERKSCVPSFCHWQDRKPSSQSWGYWAIIQKWIIFILTCAITAWFLLSSISAQKGHKELFIWTWKNVISLPIIPFLHLSHLTRQGISLHSKNGACGDLQQSFS